MYSTPPPPPTSASPPSADRVPGLAVAAGVLGILSAVPLAYLALVIVELSGEGLPGGLLWVLLLFPMFQLVGAILLLCRCSWLVLVLSSLPGVAVLLFLFLVSGNGPGMTYGPLALLVLPAVTLGCALTHDVRDWVRDRGVAPWGVERFPGRLGG